MPIRFREDGSHCEKGREKRLFSVAQLILLPREARAKNPRNGLSPMKRRNGERGSSKEVGLHVTTMKKDPNSSKTNQGVCFKKGEKIEGRQRAPHHCHLRVERARKA